VIDFISLILGINQGFADRRITKEKWLEVKSKTPLGQLPVLEIDGHKICQSRTIARFAAKSAGLLGKGYWEEMKADMMVESLIDLENIIFNWRTRLNAKEKSSKKERFAELQTSIRPEVAAFMENYEKLYCKHNKGLTWIVGDSVTYADFGWFIMFEMLVQLNLEDLIKEKAPNLYSHIERIKNIPETKNYIQNFSKTPVSVPLF